MKINRPEIINLIQRIYRQEQARGSSDASPEESKTSGKDRLELSSFAEKLQKELSQMDKPDAARTEKVEKLAQLIRDGEYKVDSGELADAILRHMDEEQGPKE